MNKTLESLTGLVLAGFVAYIAAWYLGWTQGNFALMLLLATAITGAYWVAERLYFLPQRRRSLAQAEAAMDLNGLSPVLFAEAFVGPLQQAGAGTLVILGSVAGDRGRKSNYVYGAAKGLVTRYAQGLQHRLALAGSAVKVVLVKPGPTDTAMTAHLKAQGAKLADPDEVAAAIVRGAERGQPVVYAPGKWALIMLVIRHLPRFVFNRMDI